MTDAVDRMRTLLGEVFAPMIQALDIVPVKVSENGAHFEVPASDFVMRSGNIVCGQALASIADTVGVLTLFAHNNDDRIMTTVELTTHFMRPISKGGMDVETVILANGKRMATVRTDIRQSCDTRIASSTTCAFVYV